MKNQNILIIIVALLVVVGGAWLFAKDQDKSAGNVVVEEGKNVDPAEAEDQDQESEEVDGDESETSEEEEPVTDIKVGALAPDFELMNIEGETVSLSDYRGKIVLLNFWATWCGFCDKEMPDLMKLNNEHEDVAVLAINLMEERDLVADYMEEGGYDFDVVLDIDGQVSMTYYINPLPTSYFIEEDGSLIGRIEGMLEYDQMVKIIENIKAER